MLVDFSCAVRTISEKSSAKAARETSGLLFAMFLSKMPDILCRSTLSATNLNFCFSIVRILLCQLKIDQQTHVITWPLMTGRRQCAVELARVLVVRHAAFLVKRRRAREQLGVAHNERFRLKNVVEPVRAILPKKRRLQYCGDER